MNALLGDVAQMDSDENAKKRVQIAFEKARGRGKNNEYYTMEKFLKDLRWTANSRGKPVDQFDSDFMEADYRIRRGLGLLRRTKGTAKVKVIKSQSKSKTKKSSNN